MSSTVKIRNMTLGEGLPKICVPLTGSCLEKLRQEAGQIKNSPFDFVEWRADFYENIKELGAAKEALALLREVFRDQPILFTVRTDAEGGNMAVATEAYVKLLLYAVESGLADLVDVELSRGEDTMETIVSAARKAGVKVVASCHDFSRTPDKDTIVNTLCRMQKLGADVAKYAVMPQTARDVLVLLDATLTMKEEHSDTPVITMSMGPLGAISRVCGSVFGSAATFGAVGNASAPGQLPAGLLSTFLKSLG